jgi:hypothetical protein
MELFIFGSEFNNSSLLSYSLSFFFFFDHGFCHPILSGIIDYSGTKENGLSSSLYFGVTFGNEFILFTGQDTL